MLIKIHMLTLGQLQTNCFIVADTDTNEAVVIDPADQVDEIMQVITSNDYTVREILATHAHFDHILASKPLKKQTGAPFRLHEFDVPMLQHVQQIAQQFGLRVPEAARHDDTLTEGDVVEVGAIRLETLFTPGHSPGHLSFVLHAEKVVFSGDCLFMGSIGRTDLPGGDHQMLIDSITQKILPLGDDFTVCPGHGPTTTIQQERRHNPFLQ